MPRPGRNIEQALLRSGRELYAGRGTAGLSVRSVTEHAKVNLGMFHYHFRTKDEFLRQVLASFYEDMYGALSAHAGAGGKPLDRLRETLFFVACFVRENRPLLARVLADAAAGHEVAADFIRANAPRHLGLLLALMDEAQEAGQLRGVAPLQRFIFVMSAVAMPLLIGPGLQSLGVAPAVLGPLLQPQVLGDEAIRERIELALSALEGSGRKEKKR